MSGIQVIQAAIELLPQAERAQFRAWFESFDAADWDQVFEQDVQAGALEWLTEEALEDLAAGRCRNR